MPKTEALMSVHPAADLFPMMSDGELHELAADIKEHGLRNPIALTGDGQILDGRNRIAACQIAGVEPTFHDVDGVDPLAFVISQNVKRRNLSVAQRAMAAAEAWPMYEVGQGKRTSATNGGGETRERLASLFGVGHTSIQQARTLIERDSVAATSVKNGSATLVDAYEALRSREREAEAAAAASKKLHAERSDLAELVEAGKLDRAEALLLVDREAQEKREAQQRIYTYYSNALVHLAWLGDEGQGQVHVASIAEHLQGTELDAARFREAAKTASAIADAMERRPE